MASLFLPKMHFQSIKYPIQSTICRQIEACFISSTKQHHQHQHLHHSLQLISLSKPQYTARTPSLSLHCSVSSPTPPDSKEDAIHQAKVSLFSTLEKPLNNPKLSGKLKKLKQPRLRVEIPVVDESTSTLTQLAVDVFGKMSIRKKGPPIRILLFWPDENLRKAATKVFESYNKDTVIENVDLTSIPNQETRIPGSSDLAVFMSPSASELELMKTITDTMYPKPVVIFNPKWAFEDEDAFDELSGFVGSFEVVYSFMGLEVRGILSKRKGMIFKCVRNGILSGENWNVFVEENGDLKLISTFKSRPSITEVESVLYNLMAINSPITKSAKFLKNLVANATAKK